MQRPSATEFDPFYSSYVESVPEGNLLEILATGRDRTKALLAGCSADRETFRYAPDKWSIREVVGHITDAERMYAYRVFHIARGNPSSLPGVDARGWVGLSGSTDRPLGQLIDEFSAVRSASLSLLSSLPEARWSAMGVASGRPFTVRALAYIIAGHEIHHRRLLAERYLG